MKKIFLLITFGSLAFAQQPVTISGAIPTGANTIGAVTQASGPWTVNMTQVAGSTLGALANYGTSPGAVLVPAVNAFVTNAITTTAPAPSASSTFAFTRAHANTAAAANIKASAGNLYGMVLGNSGTVDCFVQLFNNAGTPTAGTSVIDSYMVQAGVTVVIPPGQLALENFTTGIAFAGATTDSGATTTGCTTTLSTTFYYQ